MSEQIRCRCKGCTGPPSCSCCNEPVFPLPDDLHDDDATEVPSALVVDYVNNRLLPDRALYQQERAAADRLVVALDNSHEGRDWDAIEVALDAYRAARTSAGEPVE